MKRSELFERINNSIEWKGFITYDALRFTNNYYKKYKSKKAKDILISELTEKFNGYIFYSTRFDCFTRRVEADTKSVNLTIDGVVETITYNEYYYLENSNRIWYFNAVALENVAKAYTENHPHFLINNRNIPLEYLMEYYDYCDNHNNWYEISCGCESCNLEQAKLVLDYSSKAEKLLKSLDIDEKTVQFGIELELEGLSPPKLKALAPLVKHHCILKRDGSLKQGVEIVTRPATVKLHKEHLAAFMEKLPTLGFTAAKNCGMHIHVSRAPLSAAQIKRISAFVDDYKTFVAVIADRNDNAYSRMEGLKEAVSTSWRSSVKIPYSKRLSTTTSTRYAAVNCTPPNTIEFRMFASTTKPEVFYKNLEFVKALVDITTPGLMGLKPITKDDYKAFVLKYHKEYPNLTLFLKGM